MNINLRKGRIVEIQFNNGLTVIDREDLPLFAKYSYYIATRNNKSYLIRNLPDKTRTIPFHLDLMGKSESLEIDHLNGNSLDNRKANLRFVTHKENQNNMNKKRNATSKYYGVSFCARKGWQVGIHYNGKRKNLGRFENEKEAALAYNNFIISNGISKRINCING